MDGRQHTGSVALKGEINDQHTTAPLTMSFIFFGYPPKANKGASKLAVSTPDGDMEPMEPSKVKVFTRKFASTMYGSFVPLLGLVIAVLSYPAFTFVRAAVEGCKIIGDDTKDLPFENPGISVCLKKGRSLDDKDLKDLEGRGFNAMSFNGRTIFVKPRGTEQDYVAVTEMNNIDYSGPSPARFLNVNAFESWLVLRLITKKVCQLMHYLGSDDKYESLDDATMETRCKPKDNAWIHFDDDEDESDERMATGPFEFEKPHAFKLVGLEARLTTIMKMAIGGNGSSICNSRVVVNAVNGPLAETFVQSGDISKLKSRGFIAKFNPQLARPDPNLITDVISKYFLAALGNTWEEQSELLKSLKIGIAQLRLTRLGDELAHLYKSLEIAIDAQAGLVPFFTGSVYEGCIILGSCSPKVEISIHDRVSTQLENSELKNLFLTVSTHAQYLGLIANLFPDNMKPMVRQTDSMRKLWAFCQLHTGTQDQRDTIIQYASHLDFGIPPLVINPSNLKLVLGWIVNINTMPLDAPISRLALFSTDPVLLGLGCFGELDAPSWMVPGGTLCAINKRLPPTPLVNSKKARGSQGTISDATWVMTVMTTDVKTAVEDFKDMATRMKYRSIPSLQAKKLNHRSFDRERMAEFWVPLQDALKVVNPKMVVDQGEASGSPETVGREEGGGESRKRKLDFLSPAQRKLAKPSGTDKGKGKERSVEETAQWLREHAAETAKDMAGLFSQQAETRASTPDRDYDYEDGEIRE